VANGRPTGFQKFRFGGVLQMKSLEKIGSSFLGQGGSGVLLSPAQGAPVGIQIKWLGPIPDDPGVWHLILEEHDAVLVLIQNQRVSRVSRLSPRKGGQ